MGNSRDSSLGDIQGTYESILANTNPSRSPIYNPWSYLSQYGFGDAGMKQLQALIQGQQDRSLGIAGRQAGASAAAYGLNPSSAIQRAQSPIYGQFAEQFAKLPELQSLLQGRNANFLLQLLAGKSGIAGQRADESGAFGQLAGNILGLGTQFLPHPTQKYEMVK